MAVVSEGRRRDRGGTTGYCGGSGFYSMHRPVDHPCRGRTRSRKGSRLKADPAVQRRLLSLAEVDADLNRVQHRRRTLPELEEIGRAETDLRSKRDRLVATQTALGDLDREGKRLETEIDHLRAREKRDRGLMDAAAAKQVEELQHELE